MIDLIIGICYLTASLLVACHFTTRRKNMNPPNDCKPQCDGVKHLVDIYPDPSRDGAYASKFRCEACGEVYLDQIDLQEEEEKA